MHTARNTFMLTRIRRSGAILLAGVGTTLGAAAADDAGLIRQATALLEAEKPGEAVTLLEPAAQGEAAAPEVAGLLVDAYLGLGRYDTAARTLAALEARDRGAETLDRLARLARVEGKTERALALAAEAVAARRKAIQDVTTVEAASSLAALHTRLGQLALAAGKLADAEPAFRAAIKLVNDAHQKLHTLGIPHDETDGRLFAGAATDGLARVYLAQGDLRKAERTWRSVAARTKDPAVAFAAGDLAAEQGDARTATRLFDRGLQLAEGKPAHRLTLARFLADHDRDLDRALAIAEQAAAGRDDIDSLDTLAWVLHKRGDHTRASETMQRALRTGARDPLLLYHAGMIALAAGRTDEAKAQLEAAIALNPAFDPRAARLAREALGR